MNFNMLSDKDFALFQRLIFDRAGITLSDAKKGLVVSRLAKRLRHYELDSFGDYYRRLLAGDLEANEMQSLVDLLTTNETHFFRESAHYDFIRSIILPQVDKRQSFRVWSAASSSGEEAYSMAMILDDVLGESPWEVFGSDINTDIIRQAQAAVYPMSSAHEIPPNYLKRFCLKGVRQQAGYFLIDSKLRRRVRFKQVNLNDNLPDVGLFDVVFLRNVMIYFSHETKCQVVNRLLPRLRKGGHFIVGHSESLNGVTNQLKMVKPTIYQKS